MKHLYIIILVTVSYSFGFSQINVDKWSLPQKGDVLQYNMVTNPDVSVGYAGGYHTWDFSNVDSGINADVELLDPSEGSVSVDDADFLIKLGGFTEQYYKRKSYDDIYEFYRKTYDPVFQTYEVNAPFIDDKIYRKSTVVYNNTDYYISRFATAIAWSDLPDTLTSGIPSSFDSIRLSTIIDRHDHVDAYGKVILPDAEWEVLREKSTQIRKIEVSGYTFGTWITIPSNIVEQLLGDYSSLLAPDTSYHYNFYSDQAIEVIAEVVSPNEDGSDANLMTYKRGSQITNVFNPNNIQANIKVYPNPTYGRVEFTLEQVPNGDYNIAIYNLLGKKIWNRDIVKSNDKQYIKADLSDLAKGTYLYTVLDQYGNKLITKRLVIINP